jgi:hypothetical protein
VIITDGHHLVSTVSDDELHGFAVLKLHLKKCYYQDKRTTHPHYDLTTARAVCRAIKLGAALVSSKDLCKKAWWKNNTKYGKKIDKLREVGRDRY